MMPHVFSRTPVCGYTPHAPMRIVHVITRLIVGGAQENTLLSCQGQHDRGHDVNLITAPITDRIVCVADAMREQSLRAGVGKSSQYVTVYSGMETAPFLDPPMPRVAVRAQLGLSDQHVAVGTIARLFHLKGHDDLLD